MLDLQSSYRAHHSTETAVLKVLSDILLAVDNDDLALLTLLNLFVASSFVVETRSQPVQLCCLGFCMDRPYFSSARLLCCNWLSPTVYVHTCMLTISRFTASVARVIPFSCKARCSYASTKFHCGCGQTGSHFTLTSRINTPTTPDS